MNRRSTKVMKHLSKSILLREAGSPAVLKVILIFFVSIILFFIIWSANVELNQMIMAQGKILTLQGALPIQHSTGGLISNINVQEGDHVNIGDKLLDFDESTIDSQVKEETVKNDNLQQKANTLRQELMIKKNLLDQNLLSRTKYLQFERMYNETVGEITLGKNKLEKLNELKAKLSIYSPISGDIQGIGSKQRGTIINPGETVFEIIPDDREFVAQLRISPKDRGKISIGKKTTLKFSSYDFSLYGGLEGILDNISVTTYFDSKGNPYYEGTVNLPRDYIGDDERKLKILPGMTLTGEINIGTKSLLEYLIIPVKAASQSSFNEP